MTPVPGPGVAPTAQCDGGRPLRARCDVGFRTSATKQAHGRRDWFRDNAPLDETGYVTTLLGADAVKVIERHDPHTPLFLYLAFTAPHAPYQAPKEYLDRYATVADPARRADAAMTTAMDHDEIGRVIQALADPRGRHVSDAGRLAGAPLGKQKPLDGADVWTTISEGRHEGSARTMRTFMGSTSLPDEAAALDTQP